MSSSDKPRIMRPCDIPIYGTPIKEVPQSEPTPCTIRKTVSQVRVAIQEALEPLKGIDEKVMHIYQTGKAHSMTTIDQLQTEENLPMRIGFITAGGALGLAFGALRGRIFKKLFYTVLGAGGATAICYPKETYYLSQDIVEESKKFGQIGYNFVNGVQPLGISNSQPDAQVKLLEKDSSETKLSVTPDHGQGNPKDADLYTTRN